MSVNITGPITEPGLEPRGKWWEDMTYAPCMDCVADLNAVWVGSHEKDAYLRDSWNISIAHDQTCPVFRAIQRNRVEREEK